MTLLFKGVFIIIIITCVGLMIYSVINAINVSKRNKATDEAARKIFLANIENEVNNQSSRDADELLFDHKQNINSKTEELNYDEVEQINLEENSDGKTLKDFFAN